MPTPDFTSPSTFPPFSSLPLTTATTSSPPEPAPNEPEWYLLGEIRQDMTLTKPTLILADPSGQSFALVFPDASARDAPALRRALGLRPGATVVVPRARRTLNNPAPDGDDAGGDGEGEGEGMGMTTSATTRKKQGFVSIEKGREDQVKVIPARLERVLAVGAWLRGREMERAGEAGGEGEKEEAGCESCGKRAGAAGAGLMRCTGCGEVKYCGKECQVKAWNEGGHKADCKIIKGIRAIWP